jgi:hypothetical protein
MAGELRRLMARRGAIAIIGVPSAQAGLIDNLVTEPDIEWTRIVCFHTREQIGFAEESPGSERRLLNAKLVARVPIAEFHVRGEAPNLNAVCSNYDALLRLKCRMWHDRCRPPSGSPSLAFVSGSSKRSNDRPDTKCDPQL